MACLILHICFGVRFQQCYIYLEANIRKEEVYQSLLAMSVFGIVVQT
jgi:hypothetical protein